MLGQRKGWLSPDLAGETVDPGREVKEIKEPLKISDPSSSPVLPASAKGLSSKSYLTHPGTFGFTVSHTTRKPRPGEVDGVAYVVSPSEFSSLCAQGVLLEHAYFSGNYYGTSKQTIDDQTSKGLIAVLDMEMQGIKQMKANPSIDARYVFIRPPSFEALEARLRARGTENEEDLQKRLTQAQVELDYAHSEGSYDKIIVNDSIETAYKELEDFVFGQT
ncbi:guanylate kinase [Aspergillus terreus]|uniref:Guanylate kinase n=1 Tax=Aspergillus terreus TaxID=33178 RepID=A0A5M3YTZ3_ASPTE|nr:hypothetical protein ATETN484_0002080000 [Aspergillus terreus]GFF15656.1 guanylate kinase [Aspergillus terreus]